MSRHVRSVMTLIGVLTAAGCSIDVRGDAVVVTEEKRFDVGASPELTLRTFDGAIEVRSWDRREVLVQIDRVGASTQEAEGLEVRVTQEGDRIVIDAPEPSQRTETLQIGTGRSVKFVVSTPRQTTLDVTTGDGAILASELTGTISLRTGDGTIRADRVEGRIAARTGDGAVDIQQAAGEIVVDSGDGSIDVTGRLDSLRISTQDGAVRVEALEGSTMTSDWSLTTGDGAIAFRLPTGLDADIEARSDDGHIRADWTEAESRDDDRDGHSFTGKLGKGGRAIRLRTGDGSIDISRR